MIAYSRGLKKKKESYKRKIAQVVFLIFLVFVFIFFVALNLEIRKKRIQAKKELDLLEQELAGLKESNEKFSSALEGDEELFLEKFGREELNLQKEGEKVVAFPVVGESVEATSTEGAKKTKGIGGETVSLWKKFLKMLKIK